MRTILLAAAVVAAVALPLGGPPSAQQAPAATPAQPGAGTGGAAPAPAVTGPSAAQAREGDRNPAAATASGCGTTDAELAKTPVGADPCPRYPAPGTAKTD